MSPLKFRAHPFRPARLLALVMTWLCAALSMGAADVPAADRQVPSPVRRVAPDFPPELKKELTQGLAVLECLVDTEGRVQDIEVTESSHPAFGQAAVEALGQWEFTPGTINGRPEPMRIRVPFDFKLSPEQILEVVAGRPVFMEIRETVIPASQLPKWPTPKAFYLPRYPPELAGTGKYGKVVVNITIDKEGKVINPRVVKATYPEFVVPALITALKLEFPPQVMANREKIHVNLDIQWDIKAPENKKAAAEKAKAEKAKKK